MRGKKVPRWSGLTPSRFEPLALTLVYSVFIKTVAVTSPKLLQEAAEIAENISVLMPLLCVLL